MTKAKDKASFLSSVKFELDTSSARNWQTSRLKETYSLLLDL